MIMNNVGVMHGKECLNKANKKNHKVIYSIIRCILKNIYIYKRKVIPKPGTRSYIFIVFSSKVWFCIVAQGMGLTVACCVDVSCKQVWVSPSLGLWMSVVTWLVVWVLKTITKRCYESYSLCIFH